MDDTLTPKFSMESYDNVLKELPNHIDISHDTDIIWVSQHLEKSI